MRVEHRFQTSVRCPVNGARNCYAVAVRTDRLVMVEDILAAADQLAKGPSYQEDFTRQLAEVLNCQVETRGVHSAVETTVVCG
jgi:GTP cyclohydrolase I